MKISFRVKDFFGSLNVRKSFYRQCMVLLFGGREGEKYAQDIFVKITHPR